MSASEADVVHTLVVSPHRDDAAFSLGLAIECWLAAGHRVTVLNCFTQSTYAPFSDVGSLHSNDQQSFVTAVRKREDVAWNKLLRDRLRFIDLDLLDAPVRLLCRTDEVLTVPLRAGDRAVARVAGAIGKWANGSPERAVVLPMAIGGHVDHRAAREAGRQALENSPVPSAFYEDLPYAAREGEVERIPQSAIELGADLGAVFACTAEDPEVARARKRRVADNYDSQIDSATADRIAAFSGRYRGRERLWANAGWRESALAIASEVQDPR